jgi:hypothetical protein
MSLIGLIIVLILFGVLLWLFNQYVTAIDPKIKKLINIVVIVAMILFVLYAFGVMDQIRGVRVPKV